MISNKQWGQYRKLSLGQYQELSTNNVTDFCNIMSTYYTDVKVVRDGDTLYEMDINDLYEFRIHRDDPDGKWEFGTSWGVENDLFGDCDDYYDLEELSEIEFGENMKAYRKAREYAEAQVPRPKYGVLGWDAETEIRTQVDKIALQKMGELTADITARRKDQLPPKYKQHRTIRSRVNRLASAIKKNVRYPNTDLPVADFLKKDFKKIAVMILSTLNMEIISHPHIKQLLGDIKEYFVKCGEPLNYLHYIGELEYLQFTWHMPHCEYSYVNIKQPLHMYNEYKTKFSYIYANLGNILREARDRMVAFMDTQHKFYDYMNDGTPDKYYYHLRLIEQLGVDGYKAYVEQMNNHIVEKVKKLLEFLVCDFNEDPDSVDSEGRTYSNIIDGAYKKLKFPPKTGTALKKALQDVKESINSKCDTSVTRVTRGNVNEVLLIPRQGIRQAEVPLIPRPRPIPGIRQAEEPLIPKHSTTQQRKVTPNNTSRVDQRQPVPNNTPRADQRQPAPNNTPRADQRQPAPNNTHRIYQRQPAPNNTTRVDQRQPAPNNTTRVDQRQAAPNNTTRVDQRQAAPNNTTRVDQRQPAPNNTPRVYQRQPAKPNKQDK